MKGRSAFHGDAAEWLKESGFLKSTGHKKSNRPLCCQWVYRCIWVPDGEGVNSQKTRLISGPGVCSFPDLLHLGEVSEWFKERAWKARVCVNVPGVRIPPSPP